LHLAAGLGPGRDLAPRRAPAGDPCNELCGLVRGHPLGQIPDRVYKARREAEENPGVTWHRGRHLTLLWDDPRRPPTPDADPANRFRSSR